MTADDLTLRDVLDGDLELFFEHQRDPEACAMAAFVAKDPSDRAAFDDHWRRVRADATIVVKAIVVDGDVVGHIAKFEHDGVPEVCYWIDRGRWGAGIATRALLEMLRLVDERPIHARVAADNEASRRVLEKCGFMPIELTRAFANARGHEIDELVLALGED